MTEEKGRVETIEEHNRCRKKYPKIETMAIIITVCNVPLKIHPKWNPSFELKNKKKPPFYKGVQRHPPSLKFMIFFL